jgi:hypothetical protein
MTSSLVRRIVAVAAGLVALVAAVTPADGEESTPSLSRLEVALWPEYDKPAVLVLYRAHLRGDVKLPTVVPLAIPAAAGEPHAVAKHGGDGGLYVAPYTRTVKGDWATVAVQTDALDLQLEYYMPLATTAARRHFTYTWPGGIPVGELIIEVQKPATATEMTLKPPPAESAVQADGLSYFRARLGAQGARGGASVDVTYTKPDAQLTAPAGEPASGQGAVAGSAMPEALPPPGAGAEPPPASPPAAAAPRTAPEPASRDPLIWIVVAGIAVVFFVAGFLVSRSGRGSRREPPAGGPKI